MDDAVHTMDRTVIWSRTLWNQCRWRWAYSAMLSEGELAMLNEMMRGTRSAVVHPLTRPDLVHRHLHDHIQRHKKRKGNNPFENPFSDGTSLQWQIWKMQFAIDFWSIDLTYESLDLDRWKNKRRPDAGTDVSHGTGFGTWRGYLNGVVFWLLFSRCCAQQDWAPVWMLGLEGPVREEGALKKAKWETETKQLSKDRASTGSWRAKDIVVQCSVLNLKWCSPLKCVGWGLKLSYTITAVLCCC